MIRLFFFGASVNDVEAEAIVKGKMRENRIPASIEWNLKNLL